MAKVTITIEDLPADSLGVQQLHMTMLSDPVLKGLPREKWTPAQVHGFAAAPQYFSRSNQEA